jgi:hypothetical protein
MVLTGVQESFSKESDWIPAKSIAGMTTKFDFSLNLTVMREREDLMMDRSLKRVYFSILKSGLLLK